jgi:hypothetical protein
VRTGSLSTIRDLVGSPAFTDALNDFVACEMAERAERLRIYVRSGAFHEATLMEGEIAVLTDLMSRLRGLARRAE